MVPNRVKQKSIGRNDVVNVAQYSFGVKNDTLFIPDVLFFFFSFKRTLSMIIKLFV